MANIYVDDDDYYFYSSQNQARLQKTITDYECGKSTVVIKTMAELEEMANE